MMLLKIIVLFFAATAVSAKPQLAQSPTWQHPDDILQRSQIIHQQTQQQLYMQDQNRRNSMQQDQEFKIQRLQDKQENLEALQRSSTMHRRADRLKSYSLPKDPAPAPHKRRK